MAQVQGERRPMTNEIYIPNEIAETFNKLSKDEKKTVTRAIDSLEEDVLGNSLYISDARPAKGDVREARAGHLRVLFNYTAENNSIIITGVSPIEARELAHAI
jgi:mRNA-degrading endonuclease RelE of RelBE toxin-antitoxin system